jgi:hypothetical protein
VIKTLQEELEVYHQLKLPTQQTGSAISRRDEALVDELLRYHELLLIEVHLMSSFMFICYCMMLLVLENISEGARTKTRRTDH